MPWVVPELATLMGYFSIFSRAPFLPFSSLSPLALWFHVPCVGDGNEGRGQGKTDESADERRICAVVWGLTPCFLPGVPEGGILADQS